MKFGTETILVKRLRQPGNINIDYEQYRNGASAPMYLDSAGSCAILMTWPPILRYTITRPPTKVYAFTRPPPYPMHLHGRRLTLCICTAAALPYTFTRPPTQGLYLYTVPIKGYTFSLYGYTLTWKNKLTQHGSGLYLYTVPIQSYTFSRLLYIFHGYRYNGAVWLMY